MNSKRKPSGSSPDVIIVGAGVIGLATARELAGEGAKVLVLDRGEAGGEASSAAAGMISPYFEASAPDALFELSRWSAGLYPGFSRNLFQETGIDINYGGEGTLCAALSAGEAMDLEARLGWQVRAGLPLRWLSASEARDLVPELAEEVQAAALLEGDHHVHSRRLVKALAQSCRQRGVKIRGGALVTGILSSAGKVRGVLLGRERIRSHKVLIAAGSWSGDFDPGQGALSLPVEPVRGQMASLRLPERMSLGRVVHGPGCYLVPQDGVHVWVGATMERVGFVKEVTVGGLASLLAAAKRLIPALARAALVETWSGLRPESPDGMPLLGATGLKDLFAATGHFRKGILLAPATARLMAALLLGRDLPRDITPFSPLRFFMEPALA